MCINVTNAVAGSLPMMKESGQTKMTEQDLVYVCDECGEGHSSAEKMKRHINYHHPDESLQSIGREMTRAKWRAEFA